MDNEKKETVNMLQGWRCPQCGAVMAPFERSCINCTGHSIPVINAPTTASTTTPIVEPVPWWVEYNRPITITCETKPYISWL